MQCNVMALIMDSILELQAENTFAAIPLGRSRLTITLTSCEIVARTHKMYDITNEHKMLAASRLHNSVGGKILISQFDDILRHQKKGIATKFYYILDVKRNDETTKLKISL